MKIIDRYLLQAVVAATALVLAVLLGLGAFVNFAAQVGNVGSGSYSLLDALIFVALNLPTQAYEMLPIAALLGSLLGLGALASHSELIVLRASGMSVWRLARAVAAAGLVLTLIGLALGELIAPPAEQYAKRYRAAQLHKQLNFAGGQGGWIKDGNIVVNIGELFASGVAGGVRIYRFEPDGMLSSVGVAAMADVTDDQQWRLEDFKESRFEGGRVKTRKQRLEMRRTGLNPDLLRLSVVDPDQLSGVGLASYVSYLKSNGLNSDRYEIALWSRAAKVVSIFVMCLLALPFVFGSLRSAGAGTRIVIGVLFGVAYYLVSNTLASSGTVYGLDPLLTAWLPTLVLAALAALLLARSG